MPAPDNTTLPLEITVREAFARLNDAETLFLDVREHNELEICSIPGALHIPMGLIGTTHHQLPRDKSIICLCHHGMRSMHVTRYLRDCGMDRVQSMGGGIDAWSHHCDPQVPRY